MAAKAERQDSLDRADVWELILNVLEKWGNQLPEKKPCPIAHLRKLSLNQGFGPGPCRRPCCRPMLTVLREDLTVVQRRGIIAQVRSLLLAFDMRRVSEAQLLLSCREDARNALLLQLDRLIVCCQRGGQPEDCSLGGHGGHGGRHGHEEPSRQGGGCGDHGQARRTGSIEQCGCAYRGGKAAQNDHGNNGQGGHCRPDGHGGHRRPDGHGKPDGHGGHCRTDGHGGQGRPDGHGRHGGHDGHSKPGRHGGHCRPDGHGEPDGHSKSRGHGGQGRSDGQGTPDGHGGHCRPDGHGRHGGPDGHGGHGGPDGHSKSRGHGGQGRPDGHGGHCRSHGFDGNGKSDGQGGHCRLDGHDGHCRLDGQGEHRRPDGHCVFVDLNCQDVPCGHSEQGHSRGRGHHGFRACRANSENSGHRGHHVRSRVQSAACQR